MRNVYLYVVFLIFPFLSTVWGQVEIYKGNSSTQNIAGDTLYDVLWGQSDEVYLYFRNMSNHALSYKVTRVQIQPITFSMREQLCVGGPDGMGNCYILNTDEVLYEFPTIIDLAPNEKGTIEYIYENYDIPASIHNRYIVSDNLGNKLDSVDVRANATLATNVVSAPVSVSVNSYPNPVTDFLNINITGSEENSVKIYDVLGNLVYSGNMNSYKKISVSNLNNGVYILKVTSSNGKTLQSKKLIVRHL